MLITAAVDDILIFFFQKKYGLLFYGMQSLISTEKKTNKLEMCQYDIDAPAQGPFSPAHRYFAKNEIKKGHKTHNNWPVLP